MSLHAMLYKRIVNIMEVYIDRNNLLLEWIRYRKQCCRLYSRLLLRSDGFYAISPTDYKSLPHICHTWTVLARRLADANNKITTGWDGLVDAPYSHIDQQNTRTALETVQCSIVPSARSQVEPHAIANRIQAATCDFGGSSTLCDEIAQLHRWKDHFQEQFHNPAPPLDPVLMTETASAIPYPSLDFYPTDAHRRTGQHPFGGSNRVLPEWRTQLVCHAAPPGRKK